jgi:hypothetical protein
MSDECELPFELAVIDRIVAGAKAVLIIGDLRNDQPGGGLGAKDRRRQWDGLVGVEYRVEN